MLFEGCMNGMLLSATATGHSCQYSMFTDHLLDFVSLHCFLGNNVHCCLCLTSALFQLWLQCYQLLLQTQHTYKTKQKNPS